MDGMKWMMDCAPTRYEAMVAMSCPLEEITDRSDLQPAVTLWPQSQVPAFLLKSEQPSDLRMTGGDDEI